MSSELIVSIAVPVASFIISLLTALLVVSHKLGEYKNKVDTLEITLGKDEHGGLRKTLGDTKTEVDKLLEFKISAQKFIDNEIYKAKSVLGLTTYGQELVDQSGLTEIFPDVRDDLIIKLAEKKPLAKYDVQEMARGLMDELTEYKAFESIKTYAFQNGKDYGQILRAGAILLRDYYLTKHPEITQ